MSGIVNKVKEVLHSDKHSSGTAEGSHGPHNSRTANAADPRVDSDRDGSHTVGRTAGHGEFGSSTTGTTGLGHTGQAREGEHGPHSSRVANAADPRVDSDRDGSRTVGGNTGYGNTGTAGTTGYGNTGSTGLGSSGYGETREGQHGPHGSRLANAADPRVDSDRDGSRTVGGNTGSAGYTDTASFGNQNTAGGAYGSGNALGGSAPGPAPGTAGPHKSDVLNKVDPRVDSDLDGSKTVGGNRTYQTGATAGEGHDVLDASKVPPSVLRKHLGDPSIEHGDHSHDRDRRNSSTTHQDSFSGI